jgi:hypothetical protein
MTDLLLRLRDITEPGKPYKSLQQLSNEAANEIERLRAVLREIADLGRDEAQFTFRHIARRGLEGE